MHCFNKQLYVPVTVSTNGLVFSLGVFNSELSAKDAYYEYIISHQNFNDWLDDAKLQYNRLFKNVQLNDENFIESLFYDKDFWLSEYNIECLVISVNSGDTFPFYLWDSWFLWEPESSPECNNLYKTVRACHNGECFDLFEDKRTLDIYLKYCPII